ncbi:hypothetical protein PQR75_37415 [Paraburkholderia fungorum]|jgi:uncharacterized protein YhhL (DUF1145 family)|uniref:hypothetical protein n=1 Tax=Paraburkholderia fungorum TaxID=134537 RepID=UPI0038BCC508
MLRVLKAACLAIYGFGLASVVLPGSANGLAHAFELVAMTFLFIHALEIVFAFERVRRYRGPLVLSVLLTLLFGVLHWMPLMKARSRGTKS